MTNAGLCPAFFFGASPSSNGVPHRRLVVRSNDSQPPAIAMPTPGDSPARGAGLDTRFRAWAELFRFGFDALIGALSPATYNSATRDVVARQIYFTAWQILPWFAAFIVVLSLVITSILAGTARRFGLYDYALELAVRALVLEAVPLLASISSRAPDRRGHRHRSLPDAHPRRTDRTRTDGHRSDAAGTHPAGHRRDRRAARADLGRRRDLAALRASRRDRLPALERPRRRAGACRRNRALARRDADALEQGPDLRTRRDRDPDLRSHARAATHVPRTHRRPERDGAAVFALMLVETVALALQYL